MELKFRPCVLAVFSNPEGLVLVCERAEPRGSWQFPQGGIEAGETAEEAISREMREEIGTSEFDVLGRADRAIRYHFPDGGTARFIKGFAGQDGFWFHVRLRPGMSPDLAKATDREFVACDWVTPREALRRAVDFKKDAYRQGLSALGFDVEE